MTILRTYGFLVAVGAFSLLLAAGNTTPTCEPVSPDVPVCLTAVDCGEPPDCEDSAAGTAVAGSWLCEDAVCVEVCEVIEPGCPSEPPIGVDGSCEAGESCSYGEECCCGECHPSLVCDCFGDGWGCYYTDACMIPGCPDEPPPKGQCRSSEDCDGYFFCISPGESLPCGMCMDPSEIACEADEDCGEGQVCGDFQAGCLCWPADVCGPACSSAADCDAGEQCGASGHCEPIPCPGACPEHFGCNATTGHCARLACDNDLDCLPGHCVNGGCYDSFGYCGSYPP